MSEKRKIKLSVGVIYRIIVWYKNNISNPNSFLNKLFEALPVKDKNMDRWHMRINNGILLPIGGEFENLLNEKRNEVNNKYLTDEKSIKDEKGSRILKDEFKGEYSNDLQKMTSELAPILNEVREIEIDPIRAFSDYNISCAIGEYDGELTEEDFDILKLLIDNFGE